MADLPYSLTQKPTAAEQAKAEPVRLGDISALVSLLELRNRIGGIYGSEDIAMLLYCLIRRERPKNVVEIGAGLGVSAFWMAQAMKENGQGRIWTLDDASHWQDPEELHKALAPLAGVAPFDALDMAQLDYPLYFNACTELLGLQDHLTFLEAHLDLTDEAGFTEEKFPFLAEPIDFLFHDITRGPDDILDLLYLFLPRLSESASVFIDSASTSLTGYLVLERLVDQLNQSKVPRRFLLGQSEPIRRQLCELVANRRFRLMHLIERKSRPQNSTAWLKIEPNDYLPHPPTLMKW